jgi:hypothetical protein
MGIAKKCLVLISVLTLAIFPALVFVPRAEAVSGDQFVAGRIVDDVVFFTPHTMDANGIQAFLNAKVPVCETNHSSSDPANQPPFTCLKDFRQDVTGRAPEAGLCTGISAGNKSAADIIREVSLSCGVNPQVLLVLLQKEQSLITDTWPWNVQYRSATGFGCPDTAPCNEEYYGFFNQVYNAARQYRKYAKDPSQFNYRAGRNNFIQYNPNAGCGGSQVYIQNQATAGLYNYTPYQPNASALANLYGTGDSCGAYGNRNFWRMFHDWFGAPVIGQVASPLYKSKSTQAIYVIAGGKKLQVPSYHHLVALGLHKFSATEVEDSFLSNYTTGDTLTNLAKKQSDPSGTLYLFDDGKRYPVDISACSKYPDGSGVPGHTWGLDCFNSSVSKVYPNELVDMYTVQDMHIPQVIINNGLVWKMENGKKRLVTHPAFVDLIGGWSKVRYMKDLNAQQPVGKVLVLNDSIVKFDNSPNLYLIYNDVLRQVPSMSEYSAWSFDKKMAFSFPASHNSSDPLTTGSNVEGFGKIGSSDYYLISAGRRVSLAGQENNWDLTKNIGGVDGTIAQLPQIPNTGLYRSDNGTIFTVLDKKKYIFATMDDFKGIGFHTEHILPVTQSVESSLTYGGLNLKDNRLYKVQGSNQIKLTRGNGKLNVNRTDYPGLDYAGLITVDQTTDNRYIYIGEHNP